MSIMRIALPVVAAAIMSAGSIALPSAQQAAGAITVPFTDPARIGSVRVSLHSGGMVIKGGNRSDVLVSASGRGGDAPRTRTAGPGGLQRLNQSPGLTITEENNQMNISASPVNREQDVEIQVPTRVNLKLSAHNNGDVLVENADGEIEVNNHNGSIRLTNVAGSVVADTHNGDVHVTFTRITGDKPMAFTSFNGDIDVTLPASAKANLKLRSERGEIFTDFDIQMRPTATPQPARQANGRIKIEVNNAIYGSVNGGGPEFELRTYNGDIFVRKGGQ